MCKRTMQETVCLVMDAANRELKYSVEKQGNATDTRARERPLVGC